MEDNELDPNSVYEYLSYTANDGNNTTLQFKNFDEKLSNGHLINYQKSIKFLKDYTKEVKQQYKED